MTMRTPETEAKYATDRLNNNLTPLNKVEPMKEWRFWKLIENSYPHDRHHTVHHMLVLKRPRPNVWRINLFEWLELCRILEEVNPQYDYWKVNFSALQSIKNLPHIHLCVLKSEYK